MAALRGRILYLVGFDSAEAAVTWQVAELSKAWQTPVVLLGVEAPQWLAFLAKDRQRALKRRLLDVAKRLRGLKGHLAGIKAVTGDARTEARRVADQIGAELIITGAGAESVDDPLALSATAFDIARRARQDVWICKAHADPQIDHVLCAADTSARAGDAVRISVDLCRRFNARLRVLSVLQEPTGVEDPDETARAARQAQREFLDLFDLGGVALSRATVWGADAPIELLLETERYSDGLLVMGAASGSGSTGLGATAEPVLRACPSSVLIVRRRSGETADARDTGTGVASKQIADGGRGSAAAPTSPPSR
jgi:nucleotide-binding universal stress UspA family protein